MNRVINILQFRDHTRRHFYFYIACNDILQISFYNCHWQQKPTPPNNYIKTHKFAIVELKRYLLFIFVLRKILCSYIRYSSESSALGKPRASKTDEFSEKFRRGGRGGGSFPIQKFILQNLDFWTGLFWHKNDTKGYFQGRFFNNLKRN